MVRSEAVPPDVPETLAILTAPLLPLPMLRWVPSAKTTAPSVTTAVMVEPGRIDEAPDAFKPANVTVLPKVLRLPRNVVRPFVWVIPPRKFNTSVSLFPRLTVPVVVNVMACTTSVTAPLKSISKPPLLAILVA